MKVPTTDIRIAHVWHLIGNLRSQLERDRLAMGRQFLRLRNLYSERSPADVRRTSGHGVFEQACIDRLYRPRTVRDMITDYQAHLARRNGGQAETSADKRRHAREVAKEKKHKNWEAATDAWATDRLKNSFTGLDAAMMDFMRLIPHSAAQAAYKHAAKNLHPDRGGDPEKMTRLNQLWDIVETFYLAADKTAPMDSQSATVN